MRKGKEGGWNIIWMEGVWIRGSMCTLFLEFWAWGHKSLVSFMGWGVGETVPSWLGG